MIEQPQVVGLQVHSGIGRLAGTHRDHEQLVTAGGPVDPVRRGSGHLEREIGRVVVGGHAAIDKHELVLALGALGKGNDLRRKECRCRGAGTHQLP